MTFQITYSDMPPIVSKPGYKMRVALKEEKINHSIGLKHLTVYRYIINKTHERKAHCVYTLENIHE